NAPLVCRSPCTPTYCFGHTLASCMAKEQKDALDNLCNSAGFMGVGNGNLLHCWWVDSPPVSHRFSGAGNPADSGTPDHELARLHELRRSDGVATGRRISTEPMVSRPAEYRAPGFFPDRTVHRFDMLN